MTCGNFFSLHTDDGSRLPRTYKRLQSAQNAAAAASTSKRLTLIERTAAGSYVTTRGVATDGRYVQIKRLSGGGFGPV